MYPQAQIWREKPLAKSRIRCLLAHDHVLLRQGLRRLLEDEPDLEVVAEAASVAEALQIALEHRPEVVVTDTRVFGLAADQFEQLILRASPQSKVVFLTAREDDGAVPPSPAEGTNSAPRQTSAQELVEMIRRASSREKAIVREMPRTGLDSPPLPEPPRRVLTARERQVLELLAEGKTVRSAAAILGLSVKTVDAHKFNLMRKLGLHNKAELVMWAIQKRIVKLPANF
ncbi:MAG: response regulator transcription factor [Candidatus Sulfotelmatobacter sp.]